MLAWRCDKLYHTKHTLIQLVIAMSKTVLIAKAAFMCLLHMCAVTAFLLLIALMCSLIEVI